MEKAKAFIESYNEAVKNHFENFQNENSKLLEKLSKKGNENRFYDYMNRAFETLGDTIKVWEATPVAGLDGESPRQYMASIADINDLISVFKKAAVDIDEENIPAIIAEKFSEFGEKAVNALVEIISDQSLLDSEGEEASILVGAIELLGLLKSESAVGNLIDLIYMCKESDELMLETISDALTEIGSPAVTPLVQKLKISPAISTREEYILEALAGIGNSRKSDEIFMSLKDSFRRMDNKALGANYLGSYGDGRAIPALKGYIVKNLKTIDRDTFYEIAYAVEQLGGDMNDINIQFEEDSIDSDSDREWNED